MSIIDTFDASSEEILKPSLMVDPVDGFPQTVLASYSKNIFEAAKTFPGCTVISELSAGFTSIPIYKLPYKGREFAFYPSLIGGPAACGLMEEAVAKGARNFLFFGSCGTLDRKISAGRLIVPTEALRDEGTSYHYAPASDFIAIKTARRLCRIFEELGLPFHAAKTWTTDAIYRETRGNMQKRREQGCLTVEMECASLAAACAFRNIGYYQFFYTEDNLDSAVWEKRTLGSLSADGGQRWLLIALEAALRME